MVGFDSVLNSCKGISSPVDAICPEGTLACQLYQGGIGTYKKLANHIASASYDPSRTALALTSCTRPASLLSTLKRASLAQYGLAESTLLVTYEGGDHCPNTGTYRKVVITYTCGTVRARPLRGAPFQSRWRDADEGEHGCVRHQNTNSTPIFVNENPTCAYNYEWETPAGCPMDSPPTEAPTTPPGECQLAGYEWTAQYHDNRDNNTLVIDTLSFNAAGTFVQELRPADYDECQDGNMVMWIGTFNECDETTIEFSRQACSQDAQGCLTCGPTSTEYITIKFQPDCLSFVWISDDDSAEWRTYTRLA